MLKVINKQTIKYYIIIQILTHTDTHTRARTHTHTQTQTQHTNLKLVYAEMCINAFMVRLGQNFAFTYLSTIRFKHLDIYIIHCTHTFEKEATFS